MRGAALLLAAGALLGAGAAGCGQVVQEAKGKVIIGNSGWVVLPPGHPGLLSGFTLVLPREISGPFVHYASCFAGVPHPGDFGIGSSAGITKSEGGQVELPVNLHLGGATLKSYRIRVKTSSADVTLAPPRVQGSYPWLSTNNCEDRCRPGCSQFPASYYPKQFDRAAGFEYPSHVPTVTPVSSTELVIEATDAGVDPPTTGVVNLCNVFIYLQSELSAGPVDLQIIVESLKDPAGNDIVNLPLDGLAVKNFQIQ